MVRTPLPLLVISLAAEIQRMAGFGRIPPLLDDGGGAGRLLADFVGYRVRPSASPLIAYAVVWTLTLWQLARNTPPAATH